MSTAEQSLSLAILEGQQEEAAYITAKVPTRRIRRFATQPRTYFDPQETTNRAESLIAVGQQMLVKVERIFDDPDHDYEIIDGESRWRSAIEAGIEMLEVAIRRKPFASPIEKHLACLVANHNRSGHIPMDLSNALYLHIQDGKTQTELGKAIGMEQVLVGNYLSLQRLIPEIQQLLHPTTPKKDRIAPVAGFDLADVPPEQQKAVLESARRSDGRITVARVRWEVEKILGQRRKPRKQRPIERKIGVENTLRSLVSDTKRLQSASPAEIQAILREVEAKGDPEVLSRLEQLEDILKRARFRARGGSDVIPDLPILEDDATPEERIAHMQNCRLLWESKAQSREGISFLLGAAYPERRSWSVGKSAKNIWEDDFSPEKSQMSDRTE